MHGIAVIRFLVAIWLVCLGSIVCAFGEWWGLFLFVAAGLAGWLAYQMPALEGSPRFREQRTEAKVGLSKGAGVSDPD